MPKWRPFHCEFKEAVAHGRVPSQKIAQLSLINHCPGDLEITLLTYRHVDGFYRAIGSNIKVEIMGCGYGIVRVSLNIIGIMQQSSQHKLD